MSLKSLPYALLFGDLLIMLFRKTEDFGLASYSFYQTVLPSNRVGYFSLVLLTGRFVRVSDSIASSTLRPDWIEIRCVIRLLISLLTSTSLRLRESITLLLIFSGENSVFSSSLPALSVTAPISKCGGAT